MFEQVKVEDEGLKISNLDEIGASICFMHNSLSKIVLKCQPQALEYYKKPQDLWEVARGIDVHDNPILELAVSKEQLGLKRETSAKTAKTEEGKKSKWCIWRDVL